MARASVLLLALSAGSAVALFPDCANGPLSGNKVCDTSASPLDRAKALVAEFTVEEKLNNTGNSSPGVPRLGLPPYEWWNEALHGVAISPGVSFADSGDYSYATSFPQPITLGAAFDDALVREVATVIATEARAYNNANRAGLDFWTPNINPFRDPRWGRGQETPGEDPFHLSSYVNALIAGLEGAKSDKYKRVLATCKHYAGYDIEDWNGNFRYEFDAKISTQDLVEYYLPPFEACAVDSNVGAFMCSYNAINGIPTCADPYLLQDILRDHWNWTSQEQWIVGDCDALQNVFLPHAYTDTREEAVAAALNAGTDLNCGKYYQLHLPGALEKGLIDDATLDQALVRQYSSLVRLGYFDPPEDQPYRALDFSAVSTEESQQLALRAAAEGLVLLKNDAVLPLDFSGKTLALIGNWADATNLMQGNYAGKAPFLTSPLAAARKLGITVNYAPGVGGFPDPTTNNWDAVRSAAESSDIIVIVDGINNEVESEGKDRTSIAWSGGQLDQISWLASLGKPTVVVQMGAGSLDSTPILNNTGIGALLWAGYPGQDGGTAIFDALTGKNPPAGRLPVTHYPASFTRDVPMTDMALRPGPDTPGRTYRWYTGQPVFDFGFGLHYTAFSAAASLPGNGSSATFSIQDAVARCANGTVRLTRCPLATFAVDVTNEGPTRSDYVALGFAASAGAGPEPRPRKTLVAYERLAGVEVGGTATARLNVTLGGLARVEENGDRVLYPGAYQLQVDVGPLAVLEFEMTGEQVIIDRWPQRGNGTRRG